MVKSLVVTAICFLVSCSSSPEPNEGFPVNALKRLKEGNERFQNKGSQPLLRQNIYMMEAKLF